MNTFLSNELFITIMSVILAAAAVMMVFSAALKWSRDRSKKNRNTMLRRILLFLCAGVFLLSVLNLPEQVQNTEVLPFSYEELPAYDGSPYMEINGNRPFFTAEDLKREPYLSFSELDQYGRCGPASALIERSMMPKEDRGEIDSVRPSGYHNAVYEDLIEDGFLYNRCHLIGYQLCGENANEKNLITGTRYMNVEGMEPFENEAASCIRRTGKRVLLRVSPVFAGKELVCRGVLMEGYSIEDKGQEVCFCVFCYNVQPGIEIDYATGRSKAAGS